GPMCGAGCACDPGACSSANWPVGTTIRINLPQGPELTGEIAGPRGAYPGSDFDALVRVRNIGLSATGSFRYQIRLANTDTSTAGSVLLQTVVVNGGIAASTTLTSTRTLTMPAGTAVGTYYLVLVIDTNDQVSEVVETNNVVFDAGGIATAPDLQA